MNYDLIVVGLGAVGSATLYHASKMPNARILGIDKFSPPHTLGSSHGESRILRLANSEGDHYTKLALRSLELWKKIDVSGDIYTPTGGAILSSVPPLKDHQGLTIKKPNPLISRTTTIAIKNNIRHRLLSNKDIVLNYGKSIHFDQEMIGYYEEDMGYINPETAIKKQIDLARKNNAEVHFFETLIKYKKVKNKLIEVVTNKGTYLTSKLILSVGPWVKNITQKNLTNMFKIFKQVSLWFEVSNKALDLYHAKNFPIFMVDLLVDRFACFPRVNNQPSIKVLTLTHEKETCPETVKRTISESHIKNVYEKYVNPHLPGITPNCMMAQTCLYTQTEQGDFIIDYIPEYDKSVILASACSGHGFKHSMAIGESLANDVFNQKNMIDVINQFGNISSKMKERTCLQQN